MTAHRDVDLFLRAHFDATADPSVADGQIDAVLTATAGARQQPAWLAVLRSHPMTTTARSLGRPMSPAWALLIILALLIAITGVGITTGALRLPAPPPVNGPIVFGRYVAAFDDTEVVIVRPDGSGERVVVPAPAECPQVSPDGTKLAIAFGVVNIDGTNRRAFPNTAGRVTLGCSTWSPDGTRLAVEGFNDADRSENGIYLVDSDDGGNASRLTTNDQNGNDIPGDWSPDGRQISFLRGVGAEQGELWTVDVADGSARRVIPDDIEGFSAWSPDGQWLVAGRKLVQGQASQFILVRPDGSDLREIDLPEIHNWATTPSFSPDGTRLVFRMAVGTSMNADIYTMKLDGTDVIQITDTPNDNEYFVDWGIEPR
jgi:Tol biopolymer transport system component